MARWEEEIYFSNEHAQEVCGAMFTFAALFQEQVQTHLNYLVHCLAAYACFCLCFYAYTLFNEILLKTFLRRRRQRRPASKIHGWLPMYKPTGPTSHGIVDQASQTLSVYIISSLD